MNNQKIDEKWFIAFAQGDEKAFDYIFKTYYKRIYLSVYNFLKDEMEAEDVTIHTFYTLWEEHKEIQRPEHILNWLYIVSRRNCITALRKHKREKVFYKQIEKEVETISSENNFERIHSEIICQIQEEIMNLPDRMRQVFILRYTKGLPAKEVAVRMEIDIHTVYNHSKAAIEKLKIKLFDHWLESSVFFIILLFSTL